MSNHEGELPRQGVAGKVRRGKSECAPQAPAEAAIMDAREAKLAAALRDNLRRRKVAARRASDANRTED